MSFFLCHAAGNMFAGDHAREHAYDVAAANGEILTFTETQKDHAHIEALPGFDSVAVTELAIAWKTDRFAMVDSGHRMVMAGGKHGDGQHKADKRRRGPDRYALWVVLREKSTGQLWLIGDHHGPAKIDTTFLWRRWLWNQAIKGVTAEIKAAQAKHPGAQTVISGDFNRKRGVDLKLGLTEVKTPATYGKSLRYDRIQADPDVRASGIKTLSTGLDHEALVVRLSVMGAVPTPNPKPPEVTVPRTVEQAEAHCANQSAHGPKFGANECKIQCRKAYGIESTGKYATASIGWRGTKFKHPIPADLSEIPDGALIWFTGGTPTRSHPEGAGHVVKKKNGKNVQCWSTDWKRTGFFDVVNIADIGHKKWTLLKIAGWSEDIEDERVIEADNIPDPAPPPRPQPETPTRLKPSAYRLGAKGAHVTWLGKRLVAHGYGRFYKSGPGPVFTATDKRAVAAFQKAQGWTGKDADGMPGAETLKLLAKRVSPKPVVGPPAKPPASKTVAPAGSKIADYSFARPSPAALKAAGFVAVVRYISQEANDKVFSKKDLTAAEAKRLGAAGLGIILVWETTAGRAAQGRIAGMADAKAAEAQAAALGLPADQPIYYAVDSDLTAAKVRPYFDGVRSTSKAKVTGSYGGFKIADAALTDYVWQTEAWSGGKVSAKAHMIQRVHPTLKVKGAAAGSWDENDVLKPIPIWRP